MREEEEEEEEGFIISWLTVVTASGGLGLTPQAVDPATPRKPNPPFPSKTRFDPLSACSERYYIHNPLNSYPRTLIWFSPSSRWNWNIAESATRGETSTGTEAASTEEAAGDSHSPRRRTPDILTRQKDQVLREEENWTQNQTPREASPCFLFIIIIFCSSSLFWPACLAQTRSPICYGLSKNYTSTIYLLFHWPDHKYKYKITKKHSYLSIFNVQYFPKTEKYVPLFSGGDDSEIVDKRNGLRKQIEDRLTAAAASGKDLEGSFILSSIYTTNNIILLLVLTMLLTLIFQVLGSTCVSWALFKIGDWGPLD